jgi:Fe-S-cluster-containing dehydrogenase component/CRP-like cAMP-binding protein
MAASDTITSVSRPQRWDSPFGPKMTDADVNRLLARPEIAAIQPNRFPPQTPLREILRNDTRITRFKPGDLVVREGDYGSSAFLVLAGKVRVVLAPGLPRESLGRGETREKNWWAALSQLWKNRRVPEVREKKSLVQNVSQRGAAFGVGVFLQDVPAILDAHKTAVLENGALFGELAALGRVPRTASMFAETEAELLEIRWQGLREIRRYDEGWRRRIEENYRANALRVHLRATPLFSGLDEAALEQMVTHTLFETYGTFDWHVSYKHFHRENSGGPANEPVIARQGDHPDGLLLIRAGFARVTKTLGNGQRALTYLGAGDHYGLEELYEAWKKNSSGELETSLTAVGYVDVLRVPTAILEQHIFPKIPAPARRFAEAAARPIAHDNVLEWLVDERFINGTKAMLINLDRCTRCDDCVRACASTHDGNPRFRRQGKTFEHWMIANACMHCADPVCMIGCPTGAIHRAEQEGIVVINDDTCIGCSTCANSCPYDNIIMTAIHDPGGNILRDPADHEPILKATKCDLCSEQLSGPACVRACPHDALQRVDFQDLKVFER